MIERIAKALAQLKRAPEILIGNASWHWRGLHRKESMRPTKPGEKPYAPNDMEAYAHGIKTGPGIWKWEHYFEVYDRHFSKFRDQPVNVLEIGIYSGGSLGMWRSYFGPQCTVYGVDIQESCRSYENEGIHVFIGDQADRNFWRNFKREVPSIDIVIDDGGHEAAQMMVSYEELFPHLSPGGVYMVEDIPGKYNRFSAYVNGLSNQLNVSHMTHDLSNDMRRLTVRATDFQRTVHSIHTYPFVAVIEKRSVPVDEFAGPKRGTQWQPFIK